MSIELKSFKVATIYKISGGFQRAKQCAELGLPIEIETVENSDWPVHARAHGQYNFTGSAWSINLEYLKKECRKWVGKAKFEVL